MAMYAYLRLKVEQLSRITAAKRKTGRILKYQGRN